MIRAARTLSAIFADMIRGLADRELLALCAPELRCRLGLASRPFPEPRRRDRLLRKLRKTRVIRRHERRPARWRDSEPAPAVLEELGDLGPLNDDMPADAAEVGELFDPLVYDNHCAGECGELESECRCAEMDAEDEAAERAALDAPAAPISGHETHRSDVAPPPSLRRLPILAPELGPPIVLRAPALPASAHLEALPLEQLTSAAQLFRCLPLSSTITASTCLDRQGAAGDTSKAISSAGVAARQKAARFAYCKSCSLGRAVAAQIRRAS
jgi:hypothetical protein